MVSVTPFSVADGIFQISSYWLLLLLVRYKFYLPKSVLVVRGRVGQVMFFISEKIELTQDKETFHE